jgi:hypothetical protein
MSPAVSHEYRSFEPEVLDARGLTRHHDSLDVLAARHRVMTGWR